MTTNVGIRGLGVFLPPEVRRNDWWTPEHVARWMAERRAGARPEPRTAGEALVARAMAAQARDPFLGTVERRVMPGDMSALDMEERAARAAIARAGVDLRDIDLLLTNTLVPDHLLGNPACKLHARLGLERACFSMHSDVPGYAFMMQLSLAEAMIATGQAHCALLVQSCTPSRLLDLAGPLAPYFGDAATAAVVGPVSPGRGIEASVHFTDGRHAQTLAAGVPGGRWYDEGRAVLHHVDDGQAQRVFLEAADVCKQGVDAALAKARRGHADVDFFCIHQGTPWVRTVALEHLGLTSARSVETFARTGYVFSSAQPIALAFAEEQGLIHEGDLVVITGAGSGLTYGAIILGWGM
ncbi:MAG TPA: 3-oxoacyl-[acyl-carrier-protein] synthase III C-terminal domain-containing protein [Kofleriaceae bacterium]|nr:3-oxoacyl-[acyl-carrier-protein] synthase III C-terminal domain-containing protein [Kofleriaceae bacterium]